MAGSNKQRVQLGAEAVHVPVPIDEDEDADGLLGLSPTNKRSDEKSLDDHRLTTGMETVDVSSLRQLLREQIHELLGREKTQLDEAIGDLRLVLWAKWSRLRSRWWGQLEFESKIETLEKGLQDLTELLKGGQMGGGIARAGSLDEKWKTHWSSLVGQKTSGGTLFCRTSAKP